MLHRLAFQCRWAELEGTIGIYAMQLSDVFRVRLIAMLMFKTCTRQFISCANRTNKCGGYARLDGCTRVIFRGTEAFAAKIVMLEIHNFFRVTECTAVLLSNAHNLHVANHSLSEIQINPIRNLRFEQRILLIYLLHGAKKMIRHTAAFLAT